MKATYPRQAEYTCPECNSKTEYDRPTSVRADHEGNPVEVTHSESLYCLNKNCLHNTQPIEGDDDY